MEPGEALSTAAQIAVALAGFAGVVVVFRSSSIHDWAPMDKFRLLILLGNALLPLFSCLFGMLLLTIKPTPLSIWHWGSGFSLLLSFPFGFSTWRRLSGLGPAVIKNMGAYRYIFYWLPLSAPRSASCRSTMLCSRAFSGSFYAAVIFPLTVGSLQFALMILLPPHPSKT
jgi:hypothetical protein